MKNNALIVILSIVAVISGLVLNFQEFLTGSNANAKNLIVTFIYIVIWILVLVYGYKSKSRIIMMYFFIFWFATFLISMLTLYINATEATFNWAIPLVILLLGQWYGVNFFVEDYQTASIIIGSISFGISTAIILLLRRIK